MNKKIKREDHIKRIKSEVEILKKLEDHPRVIKFIDCFAYEKCKEIYCIVLQWAENGDLKGEKGFIVMPVLITLF